MKKARRNAGLSAYRQIQLTILDNLSPNLRRFCKEEGLTLEEAAARCNISKQYFCRILSGKSVPSLTVFMKICIGFGKTPNEILGFDPVEFQAQCIARRQEMDWKNKKKSMR